MIAQNRKPATLKCATARLLDGLGGLEAAAEQPGVRLGRSQLSRCASEACVETYLPIDQVALLEASTGDPVVTRFLAAEAGHVLVAVKRPAPTAVNLMHQAAELARVQAGAWARLAEALDDQIVTVDEAADCIERVDEAMTRAATVRALLADCRGPALVA